VHVSKRLWIPNYLRAEYTCNELHDLQSIGGNAFPLDKTLVNDVTPGEEPSRQVLQNYLDLINKTHHS